MIRSLIMRRTLLVLTLAGVVGMMSPFFGADWFYRGSAPTQTFSHPDIVSDTLEALWSVNLSGDAVIATPAVADGVVVLGSGDNALRGLDEQSGSLLWAYESNGDIIASPAIADGRVVFASLGGELACLELQTGEPLWSLDLQSENFGSPQIDNDHVFVVSGFPSQRVRCLNLTDGATVWETGLNQVSNSTPAFSGGYLYIADNSGTLYKLDAATGEQVWSKPLGGGVLLTMPAVAGDSVFLLPGVGSATFFRVDIDEADWATNWSVTVTDPMPPPGGIMGTFHAVSSVAVADGMAYFAIRFDYQRNTDNTNFIADEYWSNEYVVGVDLTAQTIDFQQDNGSQVAANPAAVPQYSICPTPILANDGMGGRTLITASSMDAVLTTRDAVTGAAVNAYAIGDFTRSTPAIANSRVFAATENGDVYAFENDGNHPPAAPANLAPDGNISVADTTPTLAWDAAVDADAGDTAGTLAYEVRVDFNEADLWMDAEYVEMTAVGVTAFTIPVDVPDDTQVTFSVRAMDASGAYSSWSEPAVFWVNMNLGSAPLPPSDLTTVPGDEQAGLSWTRSVSLDVRRYWLTVLDGETPVFAPIEYSNLTESATVAGLANGVLYTFELEAEDYSGLFSETRTASATPVAPVSIAGVEYGSVDAALAAAQDGDTVQLGTGEFAVAAMLDVPAGVCLHGVSPTHTILTGDSSLTAVVSLAGADACLSHVTVVGGNFGVLMNAGAAAEVNNVIVRDAAAHGIFAAAGTTADIHNVTVVNCGQAGILSASDAVSVSNSIVTGNQYGLVSTAESTPLSSSYNNVVDNAVADHDNCLPGPGAVDEAVEFVDAGNDDYHTFDGSLTVDTGDPDDLFPDEKSPSGTRINLGAYGNTAEAAVSGGLLVSSTTLSSGETNAAYSAFVNIMGGDGPYEFTLLSGDLPPGLSLNSVTGEISGTIPLGAHGAYDFAIQVEDDLGVIIFENFEIHIDFAESQFGLHIVTNAVSDAVAAQAYTVPILVGGGFPDYDFSLSAGALPEGLELDPATGVISGYPDVDAAGDYTFTVQVTDADLAVAQSEYEMSVTPSPFVKDSGGSGGGCFIATAAYGSYVDPYVMHLRRFRDEVLMPSAAGRSFVAWYYTHGPAWADWIRERDSAKAAVRIALLPLVAYAWVLTAWSSAAQMGLCFVLAMLARAILSGLHRRAWRGISANFLPRKQRLGGSGMRVWTRGITPALCGLIALALGLSMGLEWLFAANAISNLANTLDPFNPGGGQTTSISFNVTTADDCQIMIRDNTGVIKKRYMSKTLPDTAFTSSPDGPGNWNGQNDAGATLGVGSYTAHVKVGYGLSYNSKIEGNGIELISPGDVAVTSNGSYVVIDESQHFVQVFSTTGQLMVKFKGSTATDQLRGVAVDPSGNIYVGNNTTNAIEKWTSTGTLVNATWATHANLTDLAGMGQDSNYCYICDLTAEKLFRVAFSNGAVTDLNIATGNPVREPQDVTVDSSGNLYIINYNSRRVVKFSSSGGSSTDNWAVGGTGSRSSSLWCSSLNELFVFSDTEDEIYKFDTAGNTLDYVTYGSNGSGDYQFAQGTGIGAFYDSTISKTRIYAVDTGNARINVYLDDSSSSTPVLSYKVTSDVNNMSNVTDIFIDSSGNIYACVTGEHKVKKYDSGGSLLVTIGGYGTGNGLFVNPKGVVADSSGNIYVADEGGGAGGRIQKFNSSGTYQSTPVFISGGQSTKYLSGLAIDSSNFLYVCRSNQGIYKYNTSGTFQDSDTSLSNNPTDIAVDWNGNIFVVDSSRLYKFTSGFGKTTLVTGLTNTGGVAVDEFGDVYVGVSGGSIRKYSPAGTLLQTVTSSGTGDGQFTTISGLYHTTDYNSLWVADSDNNRLSKMQVGWDATATDTITINSGTVNPPTVTDVVLSDPTPTKAGTVTFQVVFDQPMKTTVDPTVKYTVNGVETTITKTGYSNNIWTGTASVGTGNDGTATITVLDAQDNDATPQTQSPNPNNNFSFSIDTVAPGTPTIFPPASPTTTLDKLAVSGTAEANATVDLYVYTASSGGSLIDSQTGIVVNGSGSWTSSPLDIQVGYNYYEARVTDSAGNVGAYNSPRVELQRVLAGPGTSSISPTTQKKIGDTGTWTITFTADSSMTNGTVTIDIPDGWTPPTLTSDVAGYVKIDTSGTVTGEAINAVSGQLITATFTSASAGDTLKIVYGDTSGGGPGATITTDATIGTNQFILQSANNDPEVNGPFSNVPSLDISVKGEDCKIFPTDAAPASAAKGQTDIKMMSLKFTNPNLVAGDEIQQLVFTVENSSNAGIVPSTAVSKVVVKDLGATYVTDTTIESSGTTITLDLTANPLLIPAGQDKTVDIRVDIPSGATAANFKLDLNSASAVLARDEDSQVTITCVADSGASFPMRSGASTITTNATADRLETSFADAMPTNCSKGQTSLKVMTLSFDNIKTQASNPNDINITQLVLTVENSANTGIIPNSVLSNIKLRVSGGGTTHISRAVSESSGSTMTLDLSVNPIRVVYGTTKQIDVIVNVAAGATQANFKINLNASTAITAKDAVNATTVATITNKSGYSFPMRSSAATVQAAANVKAKTITLNPTTSMLVGAALEVKVTMEYVSGDAAATLIPAATDLKFTIGTDKTSEFVITPRAGNPTSLAGPAGTTADLYYDVVQSAGTTTGTLVVDTSSTGPVARDSNDASDSDPLTITDTNGADTTDSVTVNASNADAVVSAVPAATPASGATKVLVLDVTITNNAGSADTLSQLKIDSLNSSDSGIIDIDVYKESGVTPGFQGAEDTQDLSPSSSDTFSGGSITMNISSNNSIAASPGTLRLYITYDLSTTITDGGTLDARIPINGITLLSAGTLESFLLNSTGTVTVNVVATRMVVDSPTGTAATGGTHVLTVQALDANGNIDLSSSQNVTITLTDPANPTLNGATITATSLSGGSTGSRTTNGNLASGQATVTITNAESETVTATPSSALGTNTADTVAFSQQATATANPVTNTSPAPGASNALIGDITIQNSTGSNDTITSITVNSGNTDDANVTDIDIYVESGATAGYQSAQDTTNLTSATGDTFSGGTKTFAFSQAVNDGTSQRLYITYDLATTGLDNNTLDCSVPQNGITLTTAGTIPISAAINSSGTVTLEVVASKIVVTATDGIAPPGQTEICTIEARDANNNRDYDSSQQVQITLSGSATVNATTLTGGATGSSSTTGTLTQGQATVTAQDNVAQTVTVTPSSALGTNTGTSIVFEADVTAPNAPVITSFNPTSPSVDDTPTVSGTAEADSTVKVYDGAVNPGNLKGTTTANTSGNWSVTLSSLSVGAHVEIKATATDQANNVSGASADAAYTVIATQASSSGTIVGFPTLALDWYTFSFYAGYVAYSDVNAPNDDVIKVLSTAGADTGYKFTVTQANGNIVGIPVWDTLVGGQKVLYFGTSLGKIYRLNDNTPGTADPVVTAGGWPFSVANSITSPIVTDRNFLFFGATDGGSPTTRMMAFDLVNLNLFFNRAAASTIQTFPAVVTNGATTYVFAASTASGGISNIYRYNVQNSALDLNDNTSSQTDILSSITVSSLSASRLHCGDLGGKMHGKDYLSAGFTNVSGWPYTGAGQIKGSAFRNFADGKVYFGDSAAKVYALNPNGTAVSGWPVTVGTSAFETGPRLFSGVLYIGNTNGKVYCIDESARTLVTTYDLGSGVKIGNISIANSMLIVGANDGKVYFLSLVNDPTP